MKTSEESKTTKMTALETARDFAGSNSWAEASVWATIAQAEATEKSAAGTTRLTAALTVAQGKPPSAPGQEADALALYVMNSIDERLGMESMNPVSPVLFEFVLDARAEARVHVEALALHRAAGLRIPPEDVTRAREAIANYRQLRLEYNEAVKKSKWVARAKGANPAATPSTSTEGVDADAALADA